MSPLPAEFTDRWRDRAEPASGEGLVYWHMLVGGYPEVAAMAQDAQQRLASFGGLHMTPLKWLHMTTLIAGSSDQISSGEIQHMAESASRLLANRAPITVTLGKILYHPEAIMLAATPAEALTPIREAAITATREISGTDGQAENRSWIPHITVCYSTSRQPAAPNVESLLFFKGSGGVSSLAIGQAAGWSVTAWPRALRRGPPAAADLRRGRPRDTSRYDPL
jgi:2'-5' RNA ligase